jgi:hypothetical protein
VPGLEIDKQQRCARFGGEDFSRRRRHPVMPERCGTRPLRAAGV